MVYYYFTLYETNETDQTGCFDWANGYLVKATSYRDAAIRVDTNSGDYSVRTTINANQYTVRRTGHGSMREEEQHLLISAVMEFKVAPISFG